MPKPITVEVVLASDESPGDMHCPLRTDLNCCGAIPGSDVNLCPEGVEDDDTGLYGWRAPDTCPLRTGEVHIVKTGARKDT